MAVIQSRGGTIYLVLRLVGDKNDGSIKYSFSDGLKLEKQEFLLVVAKALSNADNFQYR